jgi:hypothetical protein
VGVDSLCVVIRPQTPGLELKSRSRRQDVRLIRNYRQTRNPGQSDANGVNVRATAPFKKKTVAET